MTLLRAKQVGRIALIAAQQLGRTRLGSAVFSGARATLQSFGRVLHQLWLEVTGFTFLAMAAIGALAGFREFAKYQAGHAASPTRLIVAICFTASFGWFGLSSFWRVNRRVSKQRN